MKNCLPLFLLLLFSPLILYSQDVGANGDPPKEPLLISPVNKFGYSLGLTQLSNGSFISDSEANKLMLQCPKNDSVLRIEKAWKLGFLGNMLIACGAFVVEGIANHTDLFNEDVSFWCRPIEITTSLGAILCVWQESKYRSMAVMNYNLYVLGFSL
jgi:hypothetical protein